MVSDIGNRIFMLRKQKKFSQEDLADLLGLSRSTVASYENCTALPSAEVIYNLCVVLSTTSDYLLGLNHTRTISVEGLTEDHISLVQELVDGFAKVDKDIEMKCKYE